MTQDNTQDPAAIERDIERTQRDMSATVDRIGDQFTPRNIMNALLDKADSSGVDSRVVLDQAKRNPLALGMIAIGGIWLASDADARPSALKPAGFGAGSDDYDDDRYDDGFDSADYDRHTAYHRGYIDHMSGIDRLADEDDLTYRRRRNAARSNYLMLEQNSDEDENSFHDRLNSATDTMRERRDAAFEKAGDARRKSREQARRAASKGKQAYRDNPLIGGLIAAALGAVAGAAVPLSRAEEEKLGDLGEQAIDKAETKARQAADTARDKKDELVEKADSKMQDASSGTSASSSSASGTYNT